MSNFACFFDIDGVITQGPNVIQSAKKAIRTLIQQDVPFAFVSNACSFESDKAEQLSKMLGVSIHPDQVILAHTPMRCLTQYHDKHVLVCGQGPIEEIARSVGFKDITTIEKICQAFPELDMVNHHHRTNLADIIQTQGLSRDNEFRSIEAIVLFGEPIQWETSLQIITDVLLTHGNPNLSSTSSHIDQHIPIIACNKDLVFKAVADLPRFGHGAFLVCLEALYKNLTGKDLVYTALVGKPFEISYQYAEIMTNKLAIAKGQTEIKKIYFIGDNPGVDIIGANIYNEFIQQNDESDHRSITESEVLTSHPLITAEECESILVCTGIYDPNVHKIDAEKPWTLPTTIQYDVLDAVQYVLTKESQL